MGHVVANFQQRSYRWRNDDGSQDGPAEGGAPPATWKAALNTPITQAADENLRIRFCVQETGGGSASFDWKMQYNLGGAGWNDVSGSSSVVRMSSTTHVNHGDLATKNLDGTGTYVLGRCMSTVSDSGSLLAFTLGGNQNTELEFCIQIRSADVSTDDTIELRLTRSADVGGGLLDGYLEFPGLTVAPSGPTPITVELTDSLSAEDTVGTSASVERTLTDELSGTDQASRQAAHARSATDELSGEDSVSISTEVASEQYDVDLTDVIDATDEVAAQSDYAREASEDIEASDSLDVAAEPGQADTHEVDLTDTLGADDTTVRQSGYDRSVEAESLSADDTASTASSYTRSVADEAALDDQVAWASSYTRNPVDGLDAQDSASRETVYSFVLTDGIDATTSVQLGASGIVNIELTDTLTAGDDVTSGSSYARHASDSANLEDSITKAAEYSALLSSSITATDAISTSVQYTAELTDELQAVDSVLGEHARVIDVVLQDTIEADDTVDVSSFVPHGNRPNWYVAHQVELASTRVVTEIFSALSADVALTSGRFDGILGSTAFTTDMLDTRFEATTVDASVAYEFLRRG